MRNLIVFIFVGILAAGCTSMQQMQLSNKRTINCNGYRIDSLGESQEVTFKVIAYWCGTKAAVTEGNFFVLDHNSKVLERKAIDESGSVTFKLKEGFYMIGTNRGPVRTSLASYKGGQYEVVFIIGDSDVSVN